MYSAYFTAFFTVLILVIMGSVFLFFAVQSFSHDVQKYWNLLLGQLNCRLDKIPNLLETVKNYQGENTKLRQEIIDLRAKSRPLKKVDTEKVQAELVLSEKLHEIWKLVEKSAELQRNTNFLALKIEFRSLETDIEKHLENYNQKVRSYNKWVHFIFLRPLMLIFGFKKLSIFEFEGSAD